ANILQYKTDSVQDFLDFALSEAVRLSDSKLGFIMNADPDEEGFYTLSSLFRQGENRGKGKSYKLKLGEKGIWMRTIKDAKPLIINNYKDSDFYHAKVQDWHDNIDNLISIPIIFESHVKAILGIANKPRDYTDTDVLQMILLMDSVWKMVENKKSTEQILKLSRAVEQSPVLIMITDLDGSINYVNDFFSSITGYAKSEVIGKKPSILKSGETPHDVYETLWQTITSGNTWNGELHNRKANGELFWEYASITPVTDNEGRIINYLGVKEDITLRKQMTEELILARKKAEDMNRLKSAFLANMSHELRTPLVGILGYSELLSNMIPDDEQKDMAKTINSSGKRLLSTLNLILDLSRIEANRQDIHMSSFDLNDFVHDKVNLFKAAALRKGLQLIFNPLDETINLNSDPQLLEHVLNDLINNAIKFTEQGSVTVSVGLEQDVESCNALIRVSDTGIGIPHDRLEVIFDGFRQVSEGYDRSFNGTGLGLTISKRYTELLGGSLTVQSEIGVGSTFTVCFPEVYINALSFLHLEKASSMQSEAALINSERTAKPYILLIDDDVISSHLIEKFLAPIARIDYATNCEAAFQKANANAYPLIMMDINLGGETKGLELVQKIRGLDAHKSTPIIAVTAFSMVGDRERFLAHGCSHYISKPFSREELLELVGNLL
ncbi:MAG: ATP-binding protein, partial [Candidatus Cloacimonadaceae bacterium]|nr:ATP-binding protein [Candidatus Cloacimonadaceae bacterium]